MDYYLLITKYETQRPNTIKLVTKFKVYVFQTMKHFWQITEIHTWLKHKPNCIHKEVKLRLLAIKEEKKFKGLALSSFTLCFSNNSFLRQYHNYLVIWLEKRK